MKKINDKLSKVNESFTVNRYDNGFMLDIGGRDSGGDYKSAKILCSNEEELILLIHEAVTLELDS